MSPKRQRVASPAAPAIPSVNRDHFMELQSAYNVTQDTWPNIKIIDPLPESGNNGHDKIKGFMAPLSCHARQALRRGVGHVRHVWRAFLLAQPSRVADAVGAIVQVPGH